MTSTGIEAWRKARGLTQQQAADQLGISLRTFIRYERLEYEPPRYILLACAAISADLSPMSARLSVNVGN